MFLKINLTMFLTFLTQLIYAHGSFESPVSRVYKCFLEGPENPQTAPCEDMIAIGGTQPLYDWMEVNQFEANGQHLSLIPDGTLCAGGRDKYRGLNQARTDWVASSPRYNAKGQMDLFILPGPHTAPIIFVSTLPKIVMIRPNRCVGKIWKRPFAKSRKFEQVNMRYHMTCPSPGNKTGKHIIYNIWQRDLSPEAFYACIDVDFGDGVDLIFADGFE